jgi:CO dehydrogenase nickel-insertion accessory protein CooC1
VEAMPRLFTVVMVKITVKMKMRVIVGFIEKVKKGCFCCFSSLMRF